MPLRAFGFNRVEKILGAVLQTEDVCATTDLRVRFSVRVSCRRDTGHGFLFCPIPRRLDVINPKIEEERRSHANARQTHEAHQGI